MTFLLDENFPKAAASVLQDMEHEVFDVREMGMAGCTDAAVFANEGVPSAMIFVRNANGSHNPHEAMSLNDFGAGAALMRAAIEEAAQ